MAKWLVAYGVGGCWSGYPEATIIEAENKQDALAQADAITRKETAEERGNSRGASYDVELIVDSVEKTALYCSRLKPSAKAWLPI